MATRGATCRWRSPGGQKWPQVARDWIARQLLSLAGCALLLAAFASPALAGKRVALVVGNAKYQSLPHLHNPQNDAGDVAQALRTLGFEVIFRLNATKQELESALVEVARASKGAEAALFYFAGHGLQFNGRNYLMPVDAELRDEVSVRFELVGIDDVRDALSGASGVKVVVLDACRNNPLADRLASVLPGSSERRSGRRGLARIAPAGGMIVAYSTQANQVAEDGSGRNSPFTAAFLAELKVPGVEIGAMFRRIAARVYNATGGRQEPELSISLRSDFYLNGSGDAAAAALAAQNGRRTLALERQAAQLAKDEGKLAALAAEAARQESALREQLDGMAAQRKAAEKAIAAMQAGFAQALSGQKQHKQAEDALARTGDGDVHDFRFARKEAEALAAEIAAREAALKQMQERLALLEAKTAAAVGAKTPAGPPRTDEPALTPARFAGDDAKARARLAEAINGELVRLGCRPASGSKLWTSAATRRALALYARFDSAGPIPTGPEPGFLDRLRARTGRVCPLVCGPRFAARSGRCVRKTCQAGRKLDPRGRCIPPAVSAQRGPSKPLEIGAIH